MLHNFITFLSLLFAIFPVVYAHAAIKSPPIRSPGQGFLQTCGQASFDSVTGDPTGHIEEQEPFNTGCEPTLCRGMLFGDQPASNVQQVTPGQSMAMAVDCTIPHGGPANVSLLDTTAGGAGKPIGSFLATFDDFCPTSGQTPADQSNLQFKLPQANVVGDQCQKAGDCVVQLFWATPDFSQNYYYCVDVQMAAAKNTTASANTTSSVSQSTVFSASPTPSSTANVTGVITTAIPSSTAASTTKASTTGKPSTSSASSASSTSSASSASASESISSVSGSAFSALEPTSSIGISQSPDPTSSPSSPSASSLSQSDSPTSTSELPVIATITSVASTPTDGSTETPTLVLVTITSYSSLPLATAGASNSNDTVVQAQGALSGAGRRVSSPLGLSTLIGLFRGAW